MNISIHSCRRILTVVAVTVVSVMVTEPLHSAPSDPYIHRPNFIVADFDRAFEVYRDILGFKLDVIAPVAPGGFMYDVFGIQPEARIRIAFLSSVKGEFGNIGLTEVKGVELPADDGRYSTVLIVETDREIKPLFDELKAAGCNMGDIVNLTQPARTEVPFTDLDGHRIILMKLRTEN